ncbi:MAG TPA: ATP-binding protein, partial [Thermoanaerobaculia bacterium]|nr:ATP-binding protein [Thermoanaerobaculia bacterium]
PGAPVRVDDGGAGDTVLRGDPQLLERALRNLLHNAVQATAAGGAAAAPIEVRLRRAADGLEIVVEDRGPGLPAELAGRLFDPFVTARPGGIGLGLALTHRIVGLHGGSVRLEEREGGGTRAVVRLPV